MVRVVPNSSEIELQKKIEQEYFETRLPFALLYKRSKETHENLDIDIESTLGDPIELNIDWDSRKTQKELRDGFYVDTKKIEVRFCIPQLEEKGVTVEKGDILEFDKTISDYDTVTSNNPNATWLEIFRSLDEGENALFEVLQTRRDSRIKGTSERLHLLATINLEHRWEQ